MDYATRISSALNLPSGTAVPLDVPRMARIYHDWENERDQGRSSDADLDKAIELCLRDIYPSVTLLERIKVAEQRGQSGERANLELVPRHESLRGVRAAQVADTAMYSDALSTGHAMMEGFFETKASFPVLGVISRDTDHSLDIIARAVEGVDTVLIARISPSKFNPKAQLASPILVQRARDGGHRVIDFSKVEYVARKLTDQRLPDWVEHEPFTEQQRGSKRKRDAVEHVTGGNFDADMRQAIQASLLDVLEPPQKKVSSNGVAAAVKPAEGDAKVSAAEVASVKSTADENPVELGSGTEGITGQEDPGGVAKVAVQEKRTKGGKEEEAAALAQAIMASLEDDVEDEDEYAYSDDDSLGDDASA